MPIQKPPSIELTPPQNRSERPDHVVTINLGQVVKALVDYCGKHKLVPDGFYPTIDVQHDGQTCTIKFWKTKKS